jgi:hypothetical protein
MYIAHEKIEAIEKYGPCFGGFCWSSVKKIRLSKVGVTLK